MPEALRERDFERLHHCVAELYEFGGVDVFQRRVTRLLPTMVPADVTLYAEIDPRAREMKWDAAADATLGRDARRTFARHMRELPMFQRYRHGQGSATKISDFLTQREFHRTPIYNELYRRIGMEHHLAKGLPGPPDVVTAVAMLRKQPDFTERDRLVLDLLRPHLNQSYRNATLISQMQHQLTLLGAGIDALDQGLVVLGVQDRVLTATHRAERLLGDYFDRPRHGMLPEALRRWVRAHDEHVSRRDRAVGPWEPLRIPREGRELIVRIVRSDGQRLLLLSERASAPVPERLEPLGLTRREAEVLAWVAEGKANADIATILGTSVRTVDKHLERVYRKLGVENRTAAASRALEVAGG